MALLLPLPSGPNAATSKPVGCRKRRQCRAASATNALGRTRTQGRKYEKGAEAYEKAAELRPKDMALQILLGAYHHEFLKNYAQAIKHYNKYVQLGGDSGDIEVWLAEAEAEVNKDAGKK